MKFIRHSRDKVGDYQERVLLHIGVGFILGLFWFTPMTKLFIRYEENEDVHTEDQAWKDYAGALYGYPFGVLGFIAGIVALIWWLL